MKLIKSFQAFIDSGRPMALVLSVTLAVFFVTGLVQAVSTISTNISTDGTLSVTGASTLTGAVTAVGKVTSGSASTTIFSVNNTAYFGGSASTTIDVAGNIVGPGTLAITGASTFTGAVTAIGNSNSGRASTTIFSVNNTAHFGGTATTTIGPTGNITQPTTDTATTTITVGCIQAYATSTASPVRIEFGATAMGTSTFRGGALNEARGVMAWSFGTCP